MTDRLTHSRALVWGPRATALAAFVLFALLAPPGPFWLDSAELASAGAQLGAAPSSGSPLWAFLARLASLFPIGEIAFRIHLLSAVAGALAVLWTARLVIAVARGPGAEPDAATAWGAIGAGALLATSLLFLRHATVAAVHAPVVCLLAAAALLTERVAAGGGARAGLGLVIVCGLGLAVDVTFAWIAPVVAVLLMVRLYRGARFPLAAPALLAVVVGGLYAYVALRGYHGAPISASAMIERVSGAGAPAPFVADGSRGRYAADLADSLGPFGAIAALGGMVALWRRRRSWWMAAMLSSVAALDLLYALADPRGLADWQRGAPLLWAAAVGAGVGIAALVRLTGRLAWVSGGAVAALCVLPAAAMSIPAMLPGRAGDAPRAWTEAALDQVPPGGMMIAHSEALLAVGGFVTQVEGARPDLAVVPIRDRHGRARALAGGGRRAALEPGGPIEESSLVRDVIAGTPLLIIGGGPVAGDLATAARRALALLGGRAGDDRLARRTLAAALTALGQLAADRGEAAQAAALFEAARAVPR